MTRRRGRTLMRPSRRRRSEQRILTIGWWLLLSAAATWGGGPTRSVVPGSLVRWPGDGVSSCSMGDLEWSPLDGACWYPIDLQTADRTVDLERVRDGAVEGAVLAIADAPYPVERITVSEAMVHPPSRETERIRREQRQVEDVFHRPAGARRFSLPLSPPLEPTSAARSFGRRRVINGEPRSPHSGADFSAPVGTPVRAADRGVVALAAEHYFAGKSVFIDHGDRLVTMYLHLDEIRVATGDEVERDQVIGTVGATGRVTGPHLHFGVRWQGARIDPSLLLADPSSLPTIGSPAR